ncbi:MAG TPA: hypothetical protein VGC38_07905 [Pseudolabrys sp.]
MVPLVGLLAERPFDALPLTDEPAVPPAEAEPQGRLLLMPFWLLAAEGVLIVPLLVVLAPVPVPVEVPAVPDDGLAVPLMPVLPPVPAAPPALPPAPPPPLDWAKASPAPPMIKPAVNNASIFDVFVMVYSLVLPRSPT